MSEPGGIFAVLRTRRFAWYTFSNGTAFVAAWMQRLALGWIIWQLTHSGFWLGLLAICDLGPALVFGPLGGVLGDRGHPERVIAWAQGFVVVNTLATGIAAWLGVPPWVLLGFALTGGAAIAIEDAGRATIVTALAPPEQAGPAVALTAVVINLARFIGPALAGVVAMFAGVVAVFPISAVMAVPLMIFTARAEVRAPAARASTHWLRDLADALRYIRGHGLIRLVLLNFLLGSLFARAVYELVPGLANGLFHRDITGLSAMTTSLGLGAIFAGLLLMRAGGVDRAIRASFVGALLSGLVVVAMAFMPVFAGALAAAVGLGFAVSMGAIAAQIVVQLESDEAMRNRVLSLWAMIIRAAPALGALVIGGFADRLGFRLPLAAAGVVAAGAAIACWLAFRRLSAKAA